VPLVIAWKLLPHKPLDLRAGFAGKLTTVVQFIALWAIILGSEQAIAPAIAAGAIGMVAVIDYGRRAIRGPS
jgi:hypothetical protein